MNQDLLKFFEDISKDEEKLKKLFSYEDKDKMYEYALSESEGDFTKEEFEECLDSIINLSESIDSGEISKEDLESGKIDEETLSKISGGAEETLGRDIVLLVAALVPALTTIGLECHRSLKEKKKEKKEEEESKTEYNKLQKKLKMLELKRRIKEDEEILGIKS